MEKIIISFISFICLIIAITIHEFSHALAADKFGDPTPRSMGRLSLNPLAHADLIGTILLPLMGMITSVPTIGWAKPVIIDPFNFRHPKRDEIIVSLAGPLSTLILAIIVSLFLRFANIPNGIFSYISYILIVINVSLFVFNLLPIPPLDGSKIFLNLLPTESSIKWSEAFDRYGFVLLIVLLFLPIFGNNTLINSIISPIASFILRLLIPGL